MAAASSFTDGLDSSEQLPDGRSSRAERGVHPAQPSLASDLHRAGYQCVSYESAFRKEERRNVSGRESEQESAEATRRKRWGSLSPRVSPVLSDSWLSLTAPTDAPEKRLFM